MNYHDWRKIGSGDLISAFKKFLAIEKKRTI